MCVLVSLIACDEPSEMTNAKCSNCEIVMQRVGGFSDAEDPGALPDRMVYAERDASGRLFTVSRKNEAVLVFSSDGELLQQLGSAGDGPGEFRMVRRVLLGPGDSIFVSDWSLRVHVFAPNLRFVRTQTVPSPPALALQDESFVVTEQIGAADRIGYPVHHLRRDGTFGKSFGTDAPEYRRDRKLLNTRLVAAADSGDIWTVAPGRYTLERWNPVLGTRTQTISVRSDWFTELETWPEDERIRPPAVIESIWAAEGVIWLLFRVADEEWVVPERANLERSIDVDAYNATFDWVVEAVDPTSGMVLASKRFGDVLWGRAPSHVLVSHANTKAESSTFDVWQATLRERNAK